MTDSKQKYDTGHDPGSSKVRPIATPHWQPFTGFSYIFDNPGDSFSLERSYKKVSVDVESDGSLALYKRIAQASYDIVTADDLVNQYFFFPLPSSTYHVTVWDGLNQEHLKSVKISAKAAFDECFSDPPDSILNDWPPMKSQVQLRDAFRDIKSIRLRYKQLRARGSTVLVVELEPADTDSAKQLESILVERLRLDDEFLELGKPRNQSYVPHVAVGYFSHASHGDGAIRRFMDSWMSVFDQTVTDGVIEFRSISLYAFLNMITYIKPA